MEALAEAERSSAASHLQMIARERWRFKPPPNPLAEAAAAAMRAARKERQARAEAERRAQEAALLAEGKETAARVARLKQDEVTRRAKEAAIRASNYATNRVGARQFEERLDASAAARGAMHTAVKKPIPDFPVLEQPTVAKAWKTDERGPAPVVHGRSSPPARERRPHSSPPRTRPHLPRQAPLRPRRSEDLSTSTRTSARSRPRRATTWATFRLEPRRHLKRRRCRGETWPAFT